MSIMPIMSCYTGSFNVRRGWKSLNTGPRFYLCLIWRTGWWWIYISRTTDGRPFKQKKLSVPFLYHGVPTELTPFRGLGRRNLVPILPPAHTLGEGGGGRKKREGRKVKRGRRNEKRGERKEKRGGRMDKRTPVHPSIMVQRFCH